MDADALLEESDRIKQSRAPAAVVLGAAEDGRVHLVANFDHSLEGRLDAVAVIKEAAAEVGGGGGGRRRWRAPAAATPRSSATRWPRRRRRCARRARLKVVALDYGSARTGVAVSDPTGTIARPFGVVERAASEDGLERLARIVREEGAERVVVGLPLTLRGEHGAQARETDAFVEALRAALDVPVESYDERFTTGLAASVGSDEAPEDARAAAHLLSSYLAWSSAGRE